MTKVVELMTRVEALQRYLYLTTKIGCKLPEPEYDSATEEMDGLWWKMGEEFRVMAQWAISEDVTGAGAATPQAAAPHRTV